MIIGRIWKTMHLKMNQQHFWLLFSFLNSAFLSIPRAWLNQWLRLTFICHFPGWRTVVFPEAISGFSAMTAHQQLTSRTGGVPQRQPGQPWQSRVWFARPIQILFENRGLFEMTDDYTNECCHPIRSRPAVTGFPSSTGHSVVSVFATDFCFAWFYVNLHIEKIRFSPFLWPSEVLYATDGAPAIWAHHPGQFIPSACYKCLIMRPLL